MMLPSLAASTATKSASKVSLATSPTAKSWNTRPFRVTTSRPVRLTLPGILFLLYAVLSDSALPDVVGRPKRLKIAQRHCLTGLSHIQHSRVRIKLEGRKRTNVVYVPPTYAMVIPSHPGCEQILQMLA